MFGGGSAAYLRQPESAWIVPEFANCEPDLSNSNKVILQILRNFQIDFSPRKRKNRDEEIALLEVMEPAVEEPIVEQNAMVVVNAFTVMGNASHTQLFSRAPLTKVPESTIIYE